MQICEMIEILIQIRKKKLQLTINVLREGDKPRHLSR